MKSSVPNPFRDAQFFFLPDGIHLFKAIKTTMESNKTVTLPPEIVAAEGLPSDTVDYNHIQELYDFEAQYELKVAFRLKPENIHCNQQFSKMKMSTHRAVICHRTSVGLQLLSEEKGEDAYKTTAWFIEQLNNFFDLITCRTRTLALSRDNEVVYGKSIALIKKISYLFANIKFGKGLWKPCQRGVMVLCNSLLGLQEHFLGPVGNYKFVCLGRFLSDCIENLISLIRSGQAVPNAGQFFQNLKVVTLSQLSEAVKGSSYDYEESERLPGVDILELARQKAEEREQTETYKALDEMCLAPQERVTEEEISKMGTWEQNVLYDMAGAAIRSVKDSNATVCNVCLHAAQWHEESRAHPRAAVTTKKEYYAFREDCSSLLQIYPSDEVFEAILIADITFKKLRHKSMQFHSANAKQFFVENLMYVWNGSSLPDCHQLGRKILASFIHARFQQYSNKIKDKLREDRRKKAIVRRNSKSCAMKDAANLITIRPRRQSKLANNKKPTNKEKPANVNKKLPNRNKKLANPKQKPPNEDEKLAP